MKWARKLLLVLLVLGSCSALSYAQDSDYVQVPKRTLQLFETNLALLRQKNDSLQQLLKNSRNLSEEQATKIESLSNELQDLKKTAQSLANDLKTSQGASEKAQILLQSQDALFESLKMNLQQSEEVLNKLKRERFIWMLLALIGNAFFIALNIYQWILP